MVSYPAIGLQESPVPPANHHDHHDDAACPTGCQGTPALESAPAAKRPRHCDRDSHGQRRPRQTQCPGHCFNHELGMRPSPQPRRDSALMIRWHDPIRFMQSLPSDDQARLHGPNLPRSAAA